MEKGESWAQGGTEELKKGIQLLETVRHSNVLGVHS